MKKVITLTSVVAIGAVSFAAYNSGTIPKKTATKQSVSKSTTRVSKPIPVNEHWKIKEVTNVAWNTNSGIPYTEVPGANLGATSFQITDANHIAFLSNASNEIIVVEITTGKSSAKFPVEFAPRDFVHDNGAYYVLHEKEITEYNTAGQLINRFPFPDKHVGTERIYRHEGITYLLLPSGNSLPVESQGNILKAEEQNGWITNSGNRVATKLTGENSYSIKLITPDGLSTEKDFTTTKKVAGVYVVGITANSIILDLQTFVSETPISVERSLVAINISQTDIGEISKSKKLPDCYYVLSNKDLEIGSDNNVYHMVTSPDGIYMFSLAESTKSEKGNYPSRLEDMKYHFNDHLIKVD